jgi:hypothetical protein
MRNVPISTSALADLQDRFQAYVQHHAGAVGEFIVADAKADAVGRMDVYAHAYRLRLVEVLTNDYPALAALVGAEAFGALARAYIDAHPSCNPSVRWFGKHFAAFLREQEGSGSLRAELAAFEWAQGEAFDAGDAHVLALEDVARIPAAQWPYMSFEPHPTLRRLELTWNVGAFAQAVADEAPLPSPVQDDPREWLIWRRDLVVRWRSLTADEAVALDAARHRESFGAVCERLCEHVHPEEAGLHAAGLLKRWLADGLLSAVRVEA